MFPRRKDLFTAWSKAMVEGATVDKPHYPGTRLEKPLRAKKHKSHKRRSTRRRKRSIENG